MYIHVNQEHCRGCGACTNVCPSSAIRLSAEKALVDHANCTRCQACIEVCPTGALQLISENEIVSAAAPTIEMSDAAFIENEKSENSELAEKFLSLAVFSILPKVIDLMETYLEYRMEKSKASNTGSMTRGYGRPTGRRRRRRHRMFS